jgi:putative DNA primase/helicase
MDYLQRAAGYSMTGSTREQCVFIVYGSGGTGKGTFVSALQSIIGSYAAAVNFDIFLQNKSGKNWSLANLSQSRMVMCEESSSGQRLADDVFKWLTGGTDIEVEAKYGQPFTYRPKFKVWLVTNNLPRTSDTDDAIWRRMQVMVFDKKPKAQNKDLSEVFTGDAQCQAAILAWMVRGAKAYFDRDDLAPPDAVKAAISNYRADQNPLANFWQDMVFRDAEAKISRADLRGAYKRYCERNAIRPISDKAFVERIRAYGIDEASVRVVNEETGARGSRRGWAGLRLRNDDDDFESPVPFDLSPETAQEGGGYEAPS